jgi:hypothetical protein
MRSNMAHKPQKVPPPSGFGEIRTREQLAGKRLPLTDRQRRQPAATVKAIVSG